MRKTQGAGQSTPISLRGRKSNFSSLANLVLNLRGKAHVGASSIIPAKVFAITLSAHPQIDT